MAAPGDRGEVRVRLMFDYPPPALPQSRQLWFMLDTDLCRAVTDVSAIIRERFFYSRRGALSLYLDGCLLPPGESVRLIRDNEAISVKWEEPCPHNSPPQARKRQRSEDESHGCGDQALRGASKKTKRQEATPDEEQVSVRPKRKDNGAVTSEEVSERPTRKKNGVVTPEEVSKWSKKNNRVLNPKEDGEQPKKKKKKKVVVTLEEDSERPKKNGVVNLEEVRDRPKKKNKEGVILEEANEQPKKKNKEGVTLEEANERPKKKNNREVTLEEVSNRPTKVVRSLQQDSNLSIKAPEKKSKKDDLSKKLPLVAPCKGEPCSTVQKDALVNSTTSRKETSSSSLSSSDQEDVGESRRAQPGPSLKTQQKDGSLSPDSLTIKKPLMSHPAISPPVYNTHVARGGARHRPPVKTAGCGVGRGRGVENLAWRGRGFQGQGKAQVQNHFFYNYSPETVKQLHLNEDVSNVSVVIQNPPEVPKRDYSCLPLLAAPPQPGNILAFKLLELTENYTPEVSDYKEGRVLGYDPLSQQLEVEILSQPKKKEPGKFDLVYEAEDGTDVVEYAVPQECKITQAWSSLIEPRLVTEHGPQHQSAAVAQGD